jgi:hypothetical protein
MKIISYVLIALIATIPGLWIEKYAVTTPIWWTVIVAHIVGRLFGYLEGKKERKGKDD